MVLVLILEASLPIKQIKNYKRYLFSLFAICQKDMS